MHLLNVAVEGAPLVPRVRPQTEARELDEASCLLCGMLRAAEQWQLHRGRRRWVLE